jgi:hypothetical protein
MRVKIVNVDIENVVKGKSRYSAATVAYLFNGEARTQKVMSFANPDVFKKVQDFVGQEVEVTVTKNDGGYNQWSAISTDFSGGSTPTASSPPPTSSPRGSFETADERANRQVYIVKQSSLASAIALTEANKAKASPEEIIATAQKFVDYVFGNDNSIAGMASDTP